MHGEGLPPPTPGAAVGAEAAAVARALVVQAGEAEAGSRPLDAIMLLEDAKMVLVQDTGAPGSLHALAINAITGRLTAIYRALRADLYAAMGECCVCVGGGGWGGVCGAGRGAVCVGEFW